MKAREEEFECKIKMKINAGQFKLKNTKSFDAALVGIQNAFKISFPRSILVS